MTNTKTNGTTNRGHMGATPVMIPFDETKHHTKTGQEEEIIYRRLSIM